VKARLVAATVSMSELKRNPAAVFRGAGHRPMAVLKRNRVAFYVLEPILFEAIMDALADHELYCSAARSLANRSRAIEVDTRDEF
jgi:antitoxin StbD